MVPTLTQERFPDQPNFLYEGVLDLTLEGCNYVGPEGFSSSCVRLVPNSLFIYCLFTNVLLIMQQKTSEIRWRSGRNHQSNPIRSYLY